MSAGMLFVLWKGIMGFVLPIAFGFWELHKLRAYRDEDDNGPAPQPQPEPPRMPAPSVPAKPARARVLEPV